MLTEVVNATTEEAFPARPRATPTNDRSRDRQLRGPSPASGRDGAEERRERQAAQAQWSPAAMPTVTLAPEAALTAGVSPSAISSMPMGPWACPARNCLTMGSLLVVI